MDKTPTYFEPERKLTRPIQPKPNRSKKKMLVIISLFLIGGYFFWSKLSEEKRKEIVLGSDTATEVSENSPSAPEENIVSYTVAKGDIPADIFSEQGKFNANEIESLLNASQDIYDFTRLKVGQKLEFIFRPGEEKAKKIKYYLDTESIVIAEAKEKTFSVTKENIPYKTTEETLQVKIDEFLYKDALDGGLSEASILEIADIFSYDIDFTTELREGDEMKVVYEKRTLNGQAAPDGKILAAKFVNAGQEYFAYYFSSGSDDSHYDAEGHELMRQFLRAPLTYRAITSGYTGSRRHPITKTVTAHYQIDYAAPTGTPVVATARGTVTSAGFEGGWGKIVRLTHDNGYTTHYGHLSAFGKGIKPGASVSQGQVIGYVGSTGWSTGPHLDYGMRLDGNPINPMSLKLPKGTPLAGEDMQKFEEVKKKYEENLR